MKRTHVIAFSLLFSFRLCAVAAPPPGTYTTTWLGASYGSPAPVMQTLGLWVDTNGKCYTGAGWDESGPNGTVFNADGSPSNINFQTLGNGTVAGNASFIYMADGNNGIQRCQKTGQRLQGLNVGTKVRGFSANSTELFVSCFDANLVKVYDAASGGRAALLEADAVGDYAAYLVPAVAAGNYQVRVGVKKFSSRGIVQLSAGRADNFADTATNIGTAFDLYAPADEFTEIDLGVWSPVSSGDKLFRFTVAGKNAASAAHWICIDYIRLEAFSTTALTGYSAFQAAYFNSAERLDSVISGPLADPNHDGLTNIFAYALGFSSCTNPPVNTLPTPVVVNGYLQITYTRLRQPMAVGYTVEVSSDLTTWNSGPTFTTELSATPLDAIRELVTVRDNAPIATNPRRTMRLQIGY